MRLKTFHAKSMAAVMDMVRNELGPDAIIIQIEEGKAGVRVTAALEAGATPPPPKRAPEPNQTPLAFEISHPLPPSREFDNADVNAVLSHHGVPFDTAARLSEAIRAIEAASLSEAFSAALETAIRFSPITDAHSRPIMLVGPPGAGKTICAAKLTADALLHARPVHLISTDTVKAAGIQQLDHFAQLMKQTVSTADTPGELEAVIRGRTMEGGLTIIDTPGTNPFDMQELEGLLKFIQRVDAEPVLVLPAGLDPLDAQEIASVFSRMGCQRFIATRLDAARRYAGIVMAARPGHLALAAVSRSPYIAEGLETATPMGLSRLLTALPGRKKTDKPMDDRR
ncbi:MAG: GTPase [Alphaproteobacteria bacterium]|nr:MAG: GTPase [Alphaproteobacteria bacterium]